MWFTETPWPGMIVLSVIGVFCCLGWLSRRQTGYLAGAALCVALSGFVFVLERQIVTERERVEQRLFDFAETFQRDSLQQGLANMVIGGPVPRTLSFISASAEDVQHMAVEALRLVDVQDDIRISDVRTTLTNNDSRATTHFRASATVTVAIGNAGRQPTRWELTWQREKGEWKVLRAQRLNFISGRPLDHPLTGRE